MANILAIGNATLDLVYTLPGFLKEDHELRARHMHMCRGGNATNTLVVLSQLGHHCSWGGVIAQSPQSRIILDDLARYRIDTQYCQKLPGKVPTSCVMLNAETGTRSIVHYRDLPDFGFKQFQRIKLAPFDWVHFEARHNVGDIQCMIRWMRDQRPDLRCSLEVEKPRPWIQNLLPLADVLLCSRGFARANGFTKGIPFLQWLRKLAPQADLIVAWGEEGAYGLDRYDKEHACPAHVPAEIRDTLGAGDTFNAAVIDGYLRTLDFPDILSAGCQLAGKKCGQIGLDGLTRTLRLVK